MNVLQSKKILKKDGPENAASGIKDGPEIAANGIKFWYKNRKFHREDGPAIEHPDGTKHWYKNGELHRNDGPAMDDADGSKYWFIDGKLHREDGPAVVYNDGSKFWYKTDNYIEKMARLLNIQAEIRDIGYSTKNIHMSSGSFGSKHLLRY